jgi:glycosyltransferase involved in cell wall biosynthesis
VKLIIQIPCYNEAEHLPEALAALPRAIDGIDELEILVIDDGSRDGTAEVARRHGAHHVLAFSQNRGLAAAFSAGLEHALRLGADIIVNTDADNQYCADDLPALLVPILEGKADMVIGERPISEIAHFSFIKRQLQRLGSAVVRIVSGTEVRDAPSGFRAFSREAALRLNVFDRYTYTLETIIQAGRKGIAIASVPVRVNGPTRPSRLVKSIGSYVKRSVLTMFRIFITYQPLRFFLSLGSLLFLAGFALGLRFLYFYLTGEGGGKIQSTILAALLMGSGLFLAVVALVTDLIAVNRMLLERLQWRLGKLEEALRKAEDRRDSRPPFTR